MSSELAMSDRTKKFSEELDELIREGEFLAMAIEYDCNQSSFVGVTSRYLKMMTRN